MANNYLWTGRFNKAIEVIGQVGKIDPDNDLARRMMSRIIGGSPPEPDPEFGAFWRGEPLNGKSIEVFCDQGMGDTINILRYLKQMKERWSCRIVVNYYAFHAEFARLMGRLPDYIDDFVQMHRKCDYFTNIVSIPALMNGLKFDVYYPAHWQALLDTPIPPQPVLSEFPAMFSEPAFRVGLAWKSNADNPISAKKSVPIQEFAILEDGINELYAVIPDKERYNMMVQYALNDLVDTAELISNLDVVVSVDTVTLHLAGALGKKTLGLLPHVADVRWGLGTSTVWYPSVELFRQPENLDWSIPLRQIKQRLESLRSVV